LIILRTPPYCCVPVGDAEGTGETGAEVVGFITALVVGALAGGMVVTGAEVAGARVVAGGVVVAGGELVVGEELQAASTRLAIKRTAIRTKNLLTIEDTPFTYRFNINSYLPAAILTPGNGTPCFIRLFCNCT
jgi:hypothetical protein